MNVNEALEELKKGVKVRVTDDDPTIYYQFFQYDTIGRMMETGACCAEFLEFYSPEEFLKECENLAFEWVTDDESCKYLQREV